MKKVFKTIVDLISFILELDHNKHINLYELWNAILNRYAPSYV